MSLQKIQTKKGMPIGFHQNPGLANLKQKKDGVVNSAI